MTRELTELDRLALTMSVQNASKEVGPFSASVVTLQAIHAVGGEQLVIRAVADVGRELPVLASLAQSTRHLAALTELPASCLHQLRDELSAAANVVVIGMESLFIDILLDQFPQKRAFCVPHALDVDVARIASNLRGESQLCDISTFVRYAGPQSLLLTFVYGTGCEPLTYAHFLSARAVGADVRERFGAVVGIDLLGRELAFVPNDLVQVPTTSFTRLVLPRN